LLCSRNEDLKREYQLESQKKLVLLFADQVDQGVELIKINFIPMIETIMRGGCPDIIPTWQGLRENQQEAFSIVIAYMMYLSNPSDLSLDSIEKTIFEMGCSTAIEGMDLPMVRDFLSQMLCNKTFLVPLADSQLLKDRIEEIHQEVETLQSLKGLPSRKNVFHFLKAFIPHLNEKKIQTHHFEKQFNSLPVDVKKTIAGFLFRVPAYAMHSIDSDSIQKDEEKLVRFMQG
jgi:hypothetical protein